MIVVLGDPSEIEEPNVTRVKAHATDHVVKYLAARRSVARNEHHDRGRRFGGCSSPERPLRAERHRSRGGHADCGQRDRGNARRCRQVVRSGLGCRHRRRGRLGLGRQPKPIAGGEAGRQEEGEAERGEHGSNRAGLQCALQGVRRHAPRRQRAATASRPIWATRSSTPAKRCSALRRPTNETRIRAS